MEDEAKWEIHLQSRQCREINPNYNSELLVNLSNGLQAQDEDHSLNLSVASANIPWSFYTFSKDPLNNTQLYMDSTLTVDLANGNYNIYELITALNAIGGFPYTVSYGATSGLITLTNSDATGHTINFSHADSQNLAKVLGFPAVDQTVASGGSITGTCIANVRTIDGIYVYSDLATSNVFTTEKGGNVSILCKIPMDNSNPWQVIEYNPYQSAPFSTELVTKNLTSFQVSLRDQYGRLIQMNGTDWAMTFLVKLKYHKHLQDEAIKKRKLEVATEVIEFIPPHQQNIRPLETPVILPRRTTLVPPPPTEQQQQAIQNQEAEINDAIMSLIDDL